MQTDLVVIPARFGSKRFPGKPLARIAGHTVLERMIDLARRATQGLEGIEVVVASDDARIAEHANALGCAAVLTDAAITSGSGRSLAAARLYAARVHAERPRTVLNLQGDTPFLPAVALREVLAAVRAGAAVATPLIQLSWPALDALREHKRKAPFSGTTCIRAADGKAIWFSKSVLPAIRGEDHLRADELSPVFRHLGLYGFSFEALERFETMQPSHYEQLEGLEQLRLIEAGIEIRTILVEASAIIMSGIDTPADAELAEALIAQHGDPFGT